MSKLLNELIVINLKLYMSHFLIPWGVMTSHLISRGCKFIEGQQALYWSFEQSMKEYLRKRDSTYKYTILDIFYNWEHSLSMTC